MVLNSCEIRLALRISWPGGGTIPTLTVHWPGFHLSNDIPEDKIKPCPTFFLITERIATRTKAQPLLYFHIFERYIAILTSVLHYS